MFPTARNLMIANIRRQSHDALVRAVKGTREKEDDILTRIAGEVCSPADCATHRELAQFVDELLEQIPEEQRLTFTLHHYGGLTLSEVAEAMETSLPTSKSRLRLAREKLQSKLRQLGVTDSKP